MNKTALALAALTAIALAGAASARAVEFAPQEGMQGEGVPDAAQQSDPLPFVDDVSTWVQQVESEIMGTPDPINGDANVRAALAAIMAAEGTTRDSDPYRVCYGYKHRIQSFAEHPAITGEWLGEVLSDAICDGAGVPRGSRSTAAGAFQMRVATWRGVRDRLKLPDFGPDSQRAAAIELLRQRGALALIQQGRFAEGMDRARKEWASLPGAGYGQGERTMQWLTARYVAAGGVVV